MVIKANKFTTLNASGITAGGTSATLSSAAFDNGKQVPLTLDYADSAKLEVIWADITGTSLTNIVRAKDGTSAVAHSGGCGIAIGAVPSAIEYYLTENGGWLPAFEAWAYASATTITVPAGAASKYSVGDKIKLTQTTVKYFYVTAVADTVLTVTGGTDYTVANAAITANYYSKAASPVGFPHWFAYTPTGPTNTTLTGRFKISSREVSVEMKGVFTGSSNFADPTLPIQAGVSLNASGQATCLSGVGGYQDYGTANRPGGLSPLVLSTATTVKLVNTEPSYTADRGAISSTIPLNWVINDFWWVKFTYEI